MDVRHQRGRDGEELAAAHLAALGMTVVDRNWRVALDDLRGELDLVVRDGATLVFCEVKTRSSSVAGGPLAAVTWRKRRQLRRLAGLYLARHRHHGPVRGDVVTVLLAGPEPAIQHLRGVW